MKRQITVVDVDDAFDIGTFVKDTFENQFKDIDGLVISGVISGSQN